MNDRGDFFVHAVAAALVVVILTAICAKNCGTADDARLKQAVELSGYNDVRIGSWSLGCGEDDRICKSFDAVTVAGRKVHGSIGCGLVLKGCAVRIEP